MFAGVDSNHNGIIERHEYDKITQDEGVSKQDAERVWNLVQHNAKHSDTLEFAEFENLSELLYHESVAIITFVFIYGEAFPSKVRGLSFEQIQDGLKLIFYQLDGNYPLPKESDILFLFNNCDFDADKKLNVEEFFYMLSIYLKIYKSRVESHSFANLVKNDNLFEILWQKEELQDEHVKKVNDLKVYFYKFFQMAVDERILSQVANNLFLAADVNDNGSLDMTEFFKMLAEFGISEDEATLLYALTDTDSDGNILFGEFLIIFETFVHRAVAKLGYYYITELRAKMDISTTYTLLYIVAEYIHLEPVR